MWLGAVRWFFFWIIFFGECIVWQIGDSGVSIPPWCFQIWFDAKRETRVWEFQTRRLDAPVWDCHQNGHRRIVFGIVMYSRYLLCLFIFYPKSGLRPGGKRELRHTDSYIGRFSSGPLWLLIIASQYFLYLFYFKFGVRPTREDRV